MKNCIVFVCFFSDKINRKLTRLSIESIIKNSDNKTDIILFTDFEGDFSLSAKNVKIIIVKDFPQKSQTLKLKKKFKLYFFRIFICDYFDFSQYLKILYLDYDIMAEKSILPFFEFISDDSFYISYAARREWEIDSNGKKINNEYNPFTADWFDCSQYMNSRIFKESNTGVCSGIFGSKGKSLPRHLEIWKQYALKYHSSGLDLNGQHALNHLLIMDKINFRAFPDEWINYPFSPSLNENQKSGIINFENSIFRHSEKRNLKTQDEFIINHFNPGNNITKLKYMLEFERKNKISIPMGN